jgi:sugar/nucleoside kinase (ribokinase family)
MVADHGGKIAPVIVVFGTVCIDRIRRIDHLPRPGGYVEVEEEWELLGGEAANTAVALARWGDEIALAGNAIGGPRLKELVRAAGLPGPWLREEPVQTPVCDVYVTSDGERTMFGRGFATMRPGLPIEALPLEAGGWLTVEPNMLEPAREVVLRAAAAGMRPYTMDFSRPDDPVPERSFWQSSTDWVGRRGDPDFNRRYLAEWVDRHGCFGVLSDGDRGFVAGGLGRPVRSYPAFPAPSVVDPTGAGDVFRAGMLHGLSRGWRLEECLRFAAAAAALNCRGYGGHGGVGSVEEVQALAARHPDVSDAFDR